MVHSFGLFFFFLYVHRIENLNGLVGSGVEKSVQFEKRQNVKATFLFDKTFLSCETGQNESFVSRHMERRRASSDQTELESFFGVTRPRCLK